MSQISKEELIRKLMATQGQRGACPSQSGTVNNAIASAIKKAMEKESQEKPEPVGEGGGDAPEYRCETCKTHRPNDAVNNCGEPRPHYPIYSDGTGQSYWPCPTCSSYGIETIPVVVGT